MRIMISQLSTYYMLPSREDPHLFQLPLNKLLYSSTLLELSAIENDLKNYFPNSAKNAILLVPF